MPLQKDTDIKKRFCGTSSFENLRDSVGPCKQKQLFKEKLCKKFNWNVKPIIFIFCHSLIDGNFTTGKSV